MSIDFFYFDLGNVILTFDHDVMIQQVADAAGAGVEVVKRVLFDEGLQTEYETGLVDSEQFFESFSTKTNTTPDPEALLRASGDIFALNTPIIPFIAQLRAVNFPMGILSNTCEAHWNFATSRFPVLSYYFPKSILSYEVKSMKPDSRIYEAAIDLAGCSAENIMFIDDRLENVEAAKAAGLQAQVFTDAGNFIRQLEGLGMQINL